MALDVLTEDPERVAPPEDDAPPAPGRGSRVARFVLGRATRLVLLLIGVAVGGFLLLEASPLDPVDAYVGAEVTRIGPEQRAMIAERWGLDDPGPVRFARWVGNVARGDLGTSTIFDAPVTDVIASRFRTSLGLLAASWLLSGILGFGLGLLAAARRGRPLDRAIRWLAYTFASAPTFWVGLLLLTVFAVQLGWAPVCCASPIGTDPAAASLGQRLHHLVLPAVTLSLVGIAPIALHTREQAIAILDSEHVLFARAQGERGLGLIRHRVLRNAAVPAVTLQFASLSELLGGSVLAEQVFSYPGLGRATVEAGIRGDLPLLLGIALFAAVFVYVGNLLGDVAHSRLDRRVSLLDRAGQR
ncbi:ABC transporter permease [Nitriliruptor alkaliphilus]|uniref:ABC transporter permease n=1 Tax=Nitriliruptor alkaliphilus TaxID=427918 RepID=UPI001B8057BE|nr:ABC transporter permease [Nitriliruptor alkaliphilus]